MLGCSQLTPDFDSVIAIEVAVPDSGLVELGDTLNPTARALNGRGEPVSVPVSWGALDTIVAVVDTETGATWGKHVGTGRIQARVGTLRSNPVTLIVRPGLDSIKAESELRDTVTISGTPRDTLSDSLRIRVVVVQKPAALTDAQTLVRRRIVLAFTVFPGTGSAVTLVPNDTVFTDATGVAVVQVRLDSGTPPDSVKVTARSRRHDSTLVPPDSLTFVVEFRP